MYLKETVINTSWYEEEFVVTYKQLKRLQPGDTICYRKQLWRVLEMRLYQHVIFFERCTQNGVQYKTLFLNSDVVSQLFLQSFREP